MCFMLIFATTKKTETNIYVFRASFIERNTITSKTTVDLTSCCASYYFPKRNSRLNGIVFAMLAHLLHNLLSLHRHTYVVCCLLIFSIKHTQTVLPDRLSVLNVHHHQKAHPPPAKQIRWARVPTFMCRRIMSIRSVARAAWLPKRSRIVYVELFCFLASTLGTVSKRDSELFLSFSERFIEHVNVDKDVCFAKAEAFGHDLRILLVRSYRRNLRHVYAKPHDSSNWRNTDTEIQITSKPLPKATVTLGPR